MIEEHLQGCDLDSTFLVDYWVDASYFGRYHMSRWETRLPNIGALMQRDLQYYCGLGIPSIWTFVVFVDDGYLGRFTSPLIFQYGDLLWNPQADLAAGLRDFCRCYFGDEALAGVFPLEEPVDPRDISTETWDQHTERVSRALETTRAAAAETGDELIVQRLTRLAAEQEHCIAAMRQYSQEAPRDIDRRRDQPPA